MQTGLYLESIRIDRCGGVFTYLTELEDGMPAVQYIPQHRVLLTVARPVTEYLLESHKPPLSRCKPTCMHVEAPQVGLEIDVEPLALARFCVADCFLHKACGVSLALQRAGDHSVE